MKYISATYQRVKSLGNYESERLELSIQIDEDDDVDQKIRELRARVNQRLDEKILEQTVSQLQESTEFSDF